MDLSKILKGSLGESSVIVLHDLLTDSLILTKRSEALRHHPGEISFPGGQWDTNDEHLYATALRELSEELGIHTDRITLIKELEVERTLLGDVIHPWFGSINSIEPYHLNSDEVDRLLLIPMNLVVNPHNYKETLIKKNGYRIKTYQFIANEDLIWGATARIMRQLINRN